MKLDLNILPSPSPLAVHDCHPSYFSPTHHSRQDIWALFHSLVLFLVCMFILLALFCLLVVANLTLYSLVKLTSPLFTQKSYQTHRALSVHLHSIPFDVIPVPRLFSNMASSHGLSHVWVSLTLLFYPSTFSYSAWGREWLIYHPYTFFVTHLPLSLFS